MSISLSKRLQCLEKCNHQPTYFYLTQDQLENTNNGGILDFNSSAVISVAGKWHISYSLTLETSDILLVISILRGAVHMDIKTSKTGYDCTIWDLEVGDEVVIRNTSDSPISWTGGIASSFQGYLIN